MEIVLNQDLVGELRTDDGPVKITCRWTATNVLTGTVVEEFCDDDLTDRYEETMIMYSLEGKIESPMPAKYIGMKFLAMFNDFNITMTIRNDCSIKSNGAPKELKK